MAATGGGYRSAGTAVASPGVSRTHLTNDGWGFPSNCFVCEDANAAGLRIPFFHEVPDATEATDATDATDSPDDAGDAGGERVVAEFTLSDTFSGAPALAHGGVLMAVCDEAMSWCTIAVGRSFALTATNTHRFLRPVRLGRPYRVEARIVAVDDEGRFHTEATVTSVSTGKVALEAEAVFTPLDAGRAVEALGAEVAGADASYLRP